MTSWDHVMSQRKAMHSTRTKAQMSRKAGALDTYKMEVSIFDPSNWFEWYLDLVMNLL